MMVTLGCWPGSFSVGTLVKSSGKKASHCDCNRDSEINQARYDLSVDLQAEVGPHE